MAISVGIGVGVDGAGVFTGFGVNTDWVGVLIGLALAVGKNGLQTVFDCGYTYAVADSYSPDDYVAENAEALAEEMLANVKSGAILVLHFLDSAKNTPEAVDLTLTALENSGADYKFVGLNKVLG